MRLTLLALLVSLPLLATVAAAPLSSHPQHGAGSPCAAELDALDATLQQQGLADGGPRPVPGFPFLRLDRPLAAAAPPAQSAAFPAWLRRARELDRTARHLEMRNLGLTAAQQAAVERCAQRLLSRAESDPAERMRIAAHARVPDDYSLSLRILGLYPLASVGMLAGVDRLRSDIDADFRRPLAALPVHGRLVRFAPPGAAIPAVPAGPAWQVDELGLPVPSPARLRTLLARHAPVFEVDVVRPSDRVGRVGFFAPATGSRDGPGSLASVAAADPVVYWRTTMTRFGQRWLLQLEYWAWFGERPARGPLDILAGRLDGLVWRVTLDERGAAVAYDSIHPCGCYHLVLPGEALVRRPAPARYEEPVLEVPGPGPGSARVVLRVAAGSHYLQRAYRDAAPGGVAYRFAHYDALRSLPLASGERRSLFRADGLVPGTARTERWLLWMSGIASPGAMRQAGRHAVAFVGRRHFDDADLLQRYYRLREVRPVRGTAALR